MEKFGFQKEYRFWLFLFVSVNIVATIMMYTTGLSLGDTEGDRIYDKNVLLISAGIVVVSYFILLWWFYGFLVKIKVKKIIGTIPQLEKPSRILGYIVLIAQIAYILFNIKEGVNTAGMGNVKSSSIWSLFWVLIPVNAIFSIYYAFHREDPLFKYNLITFIVSNVLRGWSGIFLFIIFMEWCRAYRANKINFVKLGILGIVVLAAYPFILNMKWVIRSFEGNAANLPMFFEMFTDNLTKGDYAEWFYSGLEKLVGRLQQTSILVEVIHLKNILNDEFNKGLILPFWSDGVIQIGFRRLLGITAPPNVGVAITGHLHPAELFELGAWNVSIGFTGWFFILPGLIWLYLLYNAFLCFLSVFFIKQLQKMPGSFDVLWYAWLVYLIAGWTAQFVEFIYGIFVFVVLRVICHYLAKITFNNKAMDKSDTKNMMA